MPEAFSWNEGQAVIWTGNAVPISSAIVAYAKSVNGNHQWGWDNRVAANGQYRDHLTGQRADVSVGAFYTYDTRILRMIESATAMHLKLYHSSVNGSAGYLYYSGRFDSLNLVGGDGQVFEFTLQYHANSWSAFGG